MDESHSSNKGIGGGKGVSVEEENNNSVESVERVELSNQEEQLSHEGLSHPASDNSGSNLEKKKFLNYKFKIAPLGGQGHP